MALKSFLAGRVRNTGLPRSHALLPLIEAIVNGIQAIDARPERRARPDRRESALRLQAELDFGPAGPGRA
ncbi:hypothetical protein [Tessaracoccus defluvii]|uniref:Uncharacterized protein n=1 Tax=Tessaracoccus defluvii TaxID=1285901 RepID=A0A7H0H467_9ACTN|nr:hypothetical protein [Tessaracoccus defluvii]QNP55333.1 hypothetical protein H9L22_14065 [Tessaracoccus defluvii]